MPLQRLTLNFNRNGSKIPLLLDLDDQQFSQRIMLNHFSKNVMYEPETVRVMELLLQPGDTFIDIGGHVGFFTLLSALQVGPTGRIFAFEPEASNFRHLLHHIAINNLRNVFPLPWAVGDSVGTVEFYTNLDNDGGHALWNPGLHSYNEKSRAQVTKNLVYMTCLDEFLRGTAPGGIKLIKIDVEGNEYHVLRGARNLLQTAKIPAVIAEVNRFGMRQLASSEKDLRDLMSELDYTPYLLSGQLPMRLGADETIDSNNVFNILFINPQLQALAADKWPQELVGVTRDSAKT